MWSVIHGEAIQELECIEDCQFDSVVTDPPYGLSEITTDKTILALTHWLTDDRAFVPDGKGFMGKNWDKFVPPPAAWDEAYRVLKPGGYLLAFAGTRTYDLMCLSIRLAGFEIRDSIHWFYGNGFPKSRDIGKAIDSEAGAIREVTGYRKPEGSAIAGNAKPDSGGSHIWTGELTSSIAITDEAKQWEGWGTALKPAHEPIVMARKPFRGTVAGNVLEHGTGGINVDGCRIGTTDKWQASGKQPAAGTSYAGSADGSLNVSVSSTHEAGRWPANIVFSHSPDCSDDDCADDCPVAELNRQSGYSKSPGKTGRGAGGQHGMYSPIGAQGNVSCPDDAGGASRFFYCAKASKKERPQLDGIPGHPTVKPLKLMRYLVRLVTQPGGKVLDLFAGSGTTGEACELEGFSSVLIENDLVSIRRIGQRMSKYE